MDFSSDLSSPPPSQPGQENPGELAQSSKSAVEEAQPTQSSELLSVEGAVSASAGRRDPVPDINSAPQVGPPKCTPAKPRTVSQFASAELDLGVQRKQLRGDMRDRFVQMGPQEFLDNFVPLVERCSQDEVIDFDRACSAFKDIKRFNSEKDLQKQFVSLVRRSWPSS